MKVEKIYNLKIHDYKVLGKLPDPFIFDDGSKVKTCADWQQKRDEIIKSAVEIQFGDLIPKPVVFSVELLCLGKNNRSYRITAGTAEKQVQFLIKLVLPAKSTGPIIIDGDACANYFMQPGFIDAALDKGIGWVFFDRTELAHDVINEGRSRGQLYDVYSNYKFGAIAAWAWGYSRCIDALEKIALSDIDLDWIIATGHSRGGKAAILAGAMDERFKVVNPNEACLGGGGCYRIRCSGDYLNLPRWQSETLNDIWKETSFWFGEKLGNYVNHEADLPFDAHYLKALIAPRILLVSEATGDIWANPVGSWQTTLAANEVYKLLNAENNLYWYYREGTHYHKPIDIEMLVNVICHCRDNKKLLNGFFETPFEQKEKIFDWTCPDQ